MRAQATETAEGAVSATFTIPGLSTIPSDSDGSQQTHKVSIAELEFNSVEIEWISVPKKIASAFLKVSDDFLESVYTLPIALNSARSKIPRSMCSYLARRMSS